MSYGLEPAHLDETMTKKIHTLEQNLKCVVVALQPKPKYDLSKSAKLEIHLAPLSEAQAKQLQQTESEANLLLMAYKAA